MSSLETKRHKPSFWLSASREQAKDTGMALVLVSLIVFLVTHEKRYVTVGLGLLLLDMLWPGFFKVPAKLWFGLSHVLGTVMSKVMLSIIFYLLLTPMGIVRALCGKDPMRRRQFKRSDASAFRVRDHRFVAADIEQPF